MRAALHALDVKLSRPVSFIVGGGGAMLLAYDFPLATADIDAIPRGLSIDELKPLIQQVSTELNIAADWLNPWFSSFTHVLPNDYAERLVEVFRAEHVVALALGREDLLIMKCFAHRQKDMAHARALIRSGVKLETVYSRIEELTAVNRASSQKAQDFLEQVLELEGL